MPSFGTGQQFACSPGNAANPGQYPTLAACQAQCGGEDEVPGCDTPGACNYNPNATYNDGSCIMPSGCNYECGSTLEVDECGVCGGTCNPSQGQYSGCVQCSDGSFICDAANCPGETEDIQNCQCTVNNQCWPSLGWGAVCAIDDPNTQSTTYQCEVEDGSGILGTDVSPMQGVCINPEPGWKELGRRRPHYELLRRKGGSIKRMTSGVKRNSGKIRSQRNRKGNMFVRSNTKSDILL